MGKLYGTSRGHSTGIKEIYQKRKETRESICRCKGETWNEIHPI